MKLALRVSIMAVVATIAATPPLYAADIVAASCSRGSVQLAIDAAANGDRVLVPAGQCLWVAGVSVSGKSLTLQGAGKTATVITVSGVTGAIDLAMTNSRVTGFGFVLTAGDRIIIAQGHNFRVDHNRFENQVDEFREAVIVGGDPIHPTGVVDSNEFINCRVVVVGDLSLAADAIWSQPSTIGNPNQAQVVYVEDNTFAFSIFGNAIDSNYGGRYVFRHNTLTDVYIEAHSVQGSHRGPRSWEIYENAFNFTAEIYTAIFLRGGTGVVYNNTVAGPVTSPIVLDNVRSWVDVEFPPGPCDGTSPWDGNTPGFNGWPCRDQIGRGADTLGLFPQPQASEPAYFWGNTLNGGPADPIVDHCDPDVKPEGSCADIVIGRDYFAAPRPGYTAFAYPHLQRAGDVIPPPSLPPPTLDQVISAMHTAVTAGLLTGSGPGKSARARLETWRLMVWAAALSSRRPVLRNATCAILKEAYLLADGQPSPPDFVAGAAAPSLAQMINAVFVSLECKQRKPGRWN